MKKPLNQTPKGDFKPGEEDLYKQVTVYIAFVSFICLVVFYLAFIY